MSRLSQRARLMIAAALTVLLIAAPFLYLGPSFLVQSFKSPMLRSTWETVWALIDGYYSFGVAGGVDRFDPTQAGAAQHPTRLPWPLISVGFGLFYLALYTRRVDWRERRNVVAFTALTLNLFQRALPIVESFSSPRSWAFALIGIHAYLKRFSGDTRVRRIRETLGDVPVTAPKSYFGNLSAGAGAVEMAVSVMSLTNGVVPPILGYTRPDPNCPVTAIPIIQYRLMGRSISCETPPLIGAST